MGDTPLSIGKLPQPFFYLHPTLEISLSYYSRCSRSQHRSAHIDRGLVYNLESGGKVLRLGYTLNIIPPSSGKVFAAVMTPIDDFILVERSVLPSPSELRRIELAVRLEYEGYALVDGMDYHKFYSINYSPPVIQPSLVVLPTPVLPMQPRPVRGSGASSGIMSSPEASVSLRKKRRWHSPSISF